MKNFQEYEFKRPSGSITMYLHEGGEIVNGKLVNGKMIDKCTIKNLIVDKASELMAGRMAPGAVTGSGNPSVNGDFLDSGLKYLALGVGILSDPELPYDEITNPVDTTQWDLQNPPAENLNTTKLVGEAYRKSFTSWHFINAAGEETDDITNILSLSTTFYEDEASGLPLTEMGLFGGDALDWNEGNGKDTGFMFNHKTFKVWNKTNTQRLTVVWKLTF